MSSTSMPLQPIRSAPAPSGRGAAEPPAPSPEAEAKERRLLELLSGLGSALCDGAGYAPDNRDTMFVAGLKDVEADAADRIEAIIMAELRKLARDGIDKALVDTAIHQLEFHRKEITNQPYPYGIQLLLVFAGSWLHGGDPVRTLQLEQDLERLQSERAKGAFFCG